MAGLDATTRVRFPSLPPGATLVEHLRGHALFYWHPAERRFGNGPGCVIGQWLWDLAAGFEHDTLDVDEQPPAGALIARQVRRELRPWRAPYYR